MFRNKQVQQTLNRENRISSGDDILRDGILGPIRWIDQKLLRFGSDANKDRFSRPVTVVKKGNIFTYVLPMTTKKNKSLFCIEKDNKHIIYRKQSCNKNSYIMRRLESLKNNDREGIGEICALFKPGEGDLRPQIAEWCGQKIRVKKVKS